MSFYPEIENLSLEELFDLFRSHPIEGEEYAVVYYQEIASLISSKDEEGTIFLLSQIKEANPARLNAIIFALAELPADNSILKDVLKYLLPYLLLYYLHDEKPMIVAQVIDSLSKLGEKDAAKQVLAKIKHPSPYVRGSVLRFMTRQHPDRALPLLLEALKDRDFIVRENAADELGELGAIEAIPYLHKFLEDPHPNVRQAAESAIAMLE